MIFTRGAATSISGVTLEVDIEFFKQFFSTP
jgi:hypothetical protein